ncbi:cardiolipin synthase [Stenoxybacter acetivorans]|uniref:cardiolipin synthase n=1 Tax=Stenoxybacter acetivorans TaxID=422441 RepID=UPI000568904C|nr:cardiolipin synthase [Stenoxybacter acetivorans]
MLFSVAWGEVLLAAHFVLVLALAIRVLYRQRDIGVSVAWLVVLFSFPLIGVIAYLLVGEPRLSKTRLNRQEEMTQFFREFSRQLLLSGQQIEQKLDENYRGMSVAAAGTTGLMPTADNSMVLLDTDETILAAMKQDIQAAKHSCLLAFYIIDAQGAVQDLLEAVVQAAQRGVVCSIVADAVGSAAFWRSAWISRLRMAGVTLTEALPVRLWRSLFVRADLRNHRKIMVIDKSVAYIGSFNLVDARYFKQKANVGQWVDVMMRCEGSVVDALAAVFAVDMAVETEENFKKVQLWLAEYGKSSLKLPCASETSQSNITTQVIPSGPGQGDAVYTAIICAVYAAAHSITITTPYFVPDNTLLLALTTAAQRGVAVTLIVPKAVDSVLVKYASRAYYPRLLKAGVKIALFHGGLLHAKTLTIDEKYTLFGTVNMDMRSFYLNLEISLAIYDANITREIKALQNKYLQDCHCVELKAWQARAKWWRLPENIVRLFSPLL